MSAFCPKCGRILEDPDGLSCPSCGSGRPTSGFPRDERLGRLVAGDQYKVIRRIGAGGFGVVYEVETRVGGLRRALKVLGQRWADDTVVRERFINEALVLEQVHHPNVARCYAAGYLEQDGELYLLFELIHGVQIERLTERHPDGSFEPLEPRRAVRLAKQIAAGLQVAHKSGVLHRDLKPDNILVVNAGTPNELVKVVDFGIAKITDDGGATSTQTIVGTPEYMAPEQFLPGSSLDFRTDVWQLGATLFAMLTGYSPYRREGSGGVAGIVAEQRQRPDLGPMPSEAREALARYKALDMLVGRMLATEPDRRPATAAEVCEELARIEYGLTSGSTRRGAEALLAALCATPSVSGWVALQSYLAAQEERIEELVADADRQLESWDDELRQASLGLWEASKRGQPHPLWAIVRTLDLSGRGLSDDELIQLADNPALSTITRLDLSRNVIGDDGLAAFAASPHLGSLEHLSLQHNRFSSRGVAALARSDRLGALRSLSLDHNDVRAEGARALAEGRLALSHLSLSSNDLGSTGASALADGEVLSSLEHLDLTGNRIGPDGVASIAVSPRLADLRSLNLGHNGIGPSGAAALALSRNLCRLRTLGLSQNGLGRDGVQLLLASTAFDDLEELDLSGNTLGASGAMVLGAAPFVRRLRRLELADNGLGDAGVAALLGSSHLAGLRFLGLAQNELGPGGAGLLPDAPPQLEALDLSGNPLGDADEAIATALGRLRLRELSLRGCGLTGAGAARILDAGRLCTIDLSQNAFGVVGAEALSRSAGLRYVETLRLAFANLGAEGAAALSLSPHVGSLRVLDLSSNGLTDAGATALVAMAPRLSRLEELILEDDMLGWDAVEALSASPLATRVAVLNLAHNRLDDHAAEVLAREATWHSLRALDLSGNEIGLAGASAIAASPGLASLQRLDLSHNALTGLVDMHSLGHDKVDLMETSFAIVVTRASDVAARFYDELFARYPAVKPLFARTDMQRQQRHLLNALVLVIDNIRNPDVVEETLLELGRRHLGYGVAPSHYYAVTSTLIDVLRDAAGEDWTEAVHDAWTEGLAAISNVMMSVDRRSSSSRTPTRDDNRQSA